jgi:hypothetical protein
MARRAGRGRGAQSLLPTNAATLLKGDPIALLYVATVLAQRLDSANRGLLELKRQGKSKAKVRRAVKKAGPSRKTVERALGR